MLNLGIELSDAGVLAASGRGDDILLVAGGESGEPAAPWPGYAFHNGSAIVYGAEAEDAWFVHPRQVVNSFLSRLTHDPVAFAAVGKSPSNSELAFHFLREFMGTVTAAVGEPDRVTLAVPGAYLKDEATEEERIGLLLGIAQELRLPLVSIHDLACAALADPRSPVINTALPMVVIDVHLLAAEISLLAAEREIVRRGYVEAPHLGLSHLLKHLVGTMGNRFLRHTTFDILEDGRIEQVFYRQTKHFLHGGAHEFRYYINTEKRAYEMPVKPEQLTADTQAYVRQLEAALAGFLNEQGVAPDACTLVLTERAESVPGLEGRLRVAGYRRVVRLPAGAGARGAARIAARCEKPKDLASVPVELSLSLGDVHRGEELPWHAHLLKSSRREPAPSPSHVVIDGIGHPIGGNGTFTVGTAGAGVDLVLPEAFNEAGEGSVVLVREGGQLWFSEPGLDSASAPVAAVEAGDRLSIRCGSATVELLFIHCAPAGMELG